MNKISDLKLGISKCAYMVAEILNDLDPDFLPFDSDVKKYIGADFQTRTLYNGRERGLVFSMEVITYLKEKTLYSNKLPSKKCINAFVCEHGVSDEIKVLTWESGSAKDTMTIEDVTKDVRFGFEFKHFDYNQIHDSAYYVYDKFEKFFNDNSGKIENKKEEESITLKSKSGRGCISHFGMENN